MFPLPQLTACCACYFLLVIGAGLVGSTIIQLRRVAGLLAVLFALDWLCIGLGFAALITLRLVLLVTAFTVLVATTTPEELGLALERMRVPSRIAFTLVSAYRSLGLFESEWLAIVEAQRARGIIPEHSSHIGGRWRARLLNAASVLVPAIVLMAQRAWSIHETAAIRGFGSPLQRPSVHLRLTWLDHVLLVALGGVLIVVSVWR